MAIAPQTSLLEPPAGRAPEENSVGKFSYRLSKSLVAEITYRGSIITAADLERLKKYIDLEKDALGDQNSACCVDPSTRQTQETGQEKEITIV